MKRILPAVFAFALLPFAVFAEDPPAAPAAPTEVVAPTTCKRPMIKSNTIRKADDTSAADDAFDDYSACIKAYTDLQNLDAKAHVDAANKAINQYNDAVTAAKAARAESSPN